MVNLSLIRFQILNSTVGRHFQSRNFLSRTTESRLSEHPSGRSPGTRTTTPRLDLRFDLSPEPDASIDRKTDSGSRR